MNYQYEEYQAELSKESNCNYCGEASERDFCSKGCYSAYLKD